MDIKYIVIEPTKVEYSEKVKQVLEEKGLTLNDIGITER